MARNIRVANVEHVVQTRIGSDVSMVSSFARVVTASGAVIGVARNKAVGVHIISLQINAFPGQDCFGKYPLPLRVTLDRPCQVPVRRERDVNVASSSDYRWARRGD